MIFDINRFHSVQNVSVVPDNSNNRPHWLGEGGGETQAPKVREDHPNQSLPHGLPKASLQNRRNFFAYFSRTGANARQARET